MSPSMRVRESEPTGFPRVSGDEPGQTTFRPSSSVFSPRERG